MHWTCYGIFLEKKFIQEFDSMGGGDVQVLKSIYHWLHDSMESEGQELTSTDWCTSVARGQPRQRNGYDCGLFSIMLSLCIANDLTTHKLGQAINHVKWPLSIMASSDEPDGQIRGGTPTIAI
jgi:Ulp1 family protease